MHRRAAAWGLLILFAVILYLFSNETVTLALLISLIIALPVSFLLLRYTAGNVDLAIGDSSASEEKNSFTVTLTNKGMLPVASVDLELRCANLRVGDSDVCSFSRSLMPRGSSEITVDVKPAHAGRYELSVASAVVTDPLGVWKKPLKQVESKYVTVMPELFETEIIPAGVSAMPEADTQSKKTKGAVAGDMIGIREYVPGDPVRNIHWKLSEKTDKMLVKELGDPVTDQYLLLMDSAADIAQDPVALDAVASVFTSLIRAMREDDMIISAGWTDPQTGDAAVRRIITDEDASAAADEYLAVPAAMPSAFRKIERNLIEDRYAHVIIVGSRIPANIEDITNGCQVTILMYGGAHSFTDKNLNVAGFGAKTAATDIAGLEL